MNDLAALMRPSVGTLPVYEPGKPVELVARERGLDPASIVKLASNENPLGAPPAALTAVRATVPGTARYPDNGGYALVQALAAKHGLAPEQFALAAGSNEIFYLLCSLLVDRGVEVVMGEHAFISYLIATIRAGGTPVRVPMPEHTHDLDAMAAAITSETRLVFLPNPNNPTGTLLPKAEVEAFAAKLPDHVVFCYDEAYAEYLEEPIDLRPLIAAGRKVVCTRTFSKIYGLAGLRLGYAYTTPELAGWLNRVRPPFNTADVAQNAALAALEDTAWVQQSRAANTAALKQVTTGLTERGFAPIPSAANFVLVAVGDGPAVADALQSRGVIVRPVAGYGLPHHIRVSLGLPAENDAFFTALDAILAGQPELFHS